MKLSKPYCFHFICRKCENEIILYADQKNDVGEVFQSCQRILHEDCPMCGEEFYHNWIFEIEEGENGEPEHRGDTN